MRNSWGSLSLYACNIESSQRIKSFHVSSIFWIFGTRSAFCGFGYRNSSSVHGHVSASWGILCSGLESIWIKELTADNYPWILSFRPNEHLKEKKCRKHDICTSSTCFQTWNSLFPYCHWCKVFEIPLALLRGAALLIPRRMFFFFSDLMHVCALLMFLASRRLDEGWPGHSGGDQRKALRSW